MSQTYEIHRWDPIIFENNGMNPIPKPIIYIKPTPEVIQLAKDNSNILSVKLHVERSLYHQIEVEAVFSKSSDIPNSRPNFFDKTELYVLVLKTPWNGYPEISGKCEIFGIPTTSEETIQSRKPIKQNKQNNFIEVEKSSDNPDIHIKIVTGIGIMMTILVVFFTILYITKN
jgi:hypothetical protein